MTRHTLRVLLAILVHATATRANDFPAIGPDDWPWWRGPSFNAVAKGKPPVVEWSETKNIVWKAPVPGRGHASPSVVGPRVFVATADEQKSTQLVIAYDRASGKEL